MDLHSKIMNIQCNTGIIRTQVGSPRDYKLGHRDARHAAAEMSSKYDSLLEDILSAIRAGCTTAYIQKIIEEDLK